MDLFLSHLVEQTISTRQHSSAMSHLQQELSSPDDYKQMAALQCLCNQLNMSSSFSLTYIDTNEIVPLVLKCMQKTYNSELVLLAARTLTYMADSLSQTLGILSTDDNVNILLQNLRQIQDMELSDQCLTCLEKLCQFSTGAAAVFRYNGIEDMLSFIDFFTISSQRKIWNAISRMSCFLTVSNYSYIAGVLPIIHNNIIHSDPQIRAKAIITLLRAIVGVSEKAEMVTKVFGDLACPLLGILSKPSHTDATFSTALSLILAATKYSPTVTRQIIECGIFQQLVGLLAAYTTLPSATVVSESPFSDNGSPNGGVTAALSDGAAPVSKGPQHFRLSFNQTHDICEILAACLLPCRVEYLAYLNELVHMEMKGRFAHPQGSMQLYNEGFDEESKSHKEEEGILESDEENSEEPAEDNGAQCNSDELRSRIYERDDIKLSTKQAHQSCKAGSHSCDVCDKFCHPGDWYRCNECHDCDYCGACLLKQFKEHCGGKHTFTDMIFCGQQLPASMAIRPNVEVEKQRRDMFAQSPELFDVVLSVVPSVVRLCTESEALKIRISVINFLLSALMMASGEQLVSGGFCNAAMCEVLDAMLRDSHLTLNALVVILLKILLKKIPESFRPLLVREGVSHALFCFKKRCLSLGTQDSSSGAPIPIEKRIHSIQGWRDLLSEEASSLLALFPRDDEASVGSRQLEEIAAYLQRDDLDCAMQLLRQALLADLTPHELLSHDIVHELRAAMVRCGDAKRIIRAFCLLSEPGDDDDADRSNCPAGAAPTPLSRLIRCLQTILSRLDHFEQPSTALSQRSRSQIMLRLSPHAVKEATTVERAKSDKRKARAVGRDPAREISPQSEASLNGGGGGTGGLPPRKSRGSTAATNTATELSFVIGIDPLATVSLVVDFLRTKLFAGRGRRQQGVLDNAIWFGSDSGTDDGGVEEVLPELGRSPEGKTSAPATPVEVQTKTKRSRMPRPTLWLRYHEQVLPLSMTILQVIQQLVKDEPQGGERLSRSVASQPATPGLPRASIQTRQEEPITLYYSSEPFGSGYELLSNYCDTYEVSPSVIYLPSQESRPAAVLSLLEQVNAAFTHSKTFLSEAQMDVLSLLGSFYVYTTNKATLIQYCEEGLGRDARLSIKSAATSGITQADFIHHKLDNKALRHCSSELLAGQQASTWGVRLALDCNFLFTSLTRKFLFQVSFCGTIRSLVRLQQANLGSSVNESSRSSNVRTRTIQLVRKKKRVWRQHALRCAMELLGKPYRPSGSVVWEFDFYGEEGSGTGPTREYYTLLSKALQERTLNLWMTTHEEPEDTHYSPANGLYPRLLSPALTDDAKHEVQIYFRFIGRFLARAILDGHVTSLPLSLIFIKLLRGDACGVEEVCAIDNAVGKVLLAMLRAHREGTGQLRLSGHATCLSVEAMDLTFVCPGADAVELVDGGAALQVNARNMLMYCDLVTQFWLKTGVEVAVDALRQGFHDYIPLVALRMLTVEEIYDIINGSTAPITRQEFEENCLADHGYTLICRHVQWLFDILASFCIEEQRKFFSFLTGSPHLPVGGLASLKPKMTIVRKTSSDASVKEDDQLPSAMTCQNYLKLPAYETKEQMEKKLLLAINEGTGAFLLT